MADIFITNPHYKNERFSLKSFVFWIIGIIALIGLDQLSKYVVTTSGTGSFLNILGPFVQKMNFRNYNFAFSLPVPHIVMYLLYGAICIAIAIYLTKRYTTLSTWARIGWMLIIAGAVSNITERIILGYVRDFILIATGIFNVADVYILAGVIILLFAKSEK